ncbi:MAG: peptidoglycan-binding protein [Candidatus Omnitrophica bacterium]|nr:peptidoglycan-binding protein [Candidatus Omnitrophota bacterium]
MGQRGRAAANSSQALTPAGAPLPAVQIEPIQPHEELAAITGTQASSTAPAAKENQPSSSPSTKQLAFTATASPATAPLEESARVKEIQLALKAAGFDPGAIDGQLGNKTKVAVADFQRANGLEPDGKVGPRTWSKLEPYVNAKGKTQSSSD